MHSIQISLFVEYMICRQIISYTILQGIPNCRNAYLESEPIYPIWR